MNTPTSPYAAAIAMERAKISEYEKRIAACLARIAALEGLADGVQDDVDAALERKLSGSNGMTRVAAEVGTSKYEAVPPASLANSSAPIHPGLPPLPKLPAAEVSPVTQALPGISPFAPPPPAPANPFIAPPVPPHPFTAPPAPPNPFTAPPGPVNPFIAPPQAPTVPSELAGERSQGDEGSSFVLPKRQVSAQAIELLRFLRTPATSDSTFEFVEKRSLGMNRAALSTFLYAYRTKYGFLESRADGTYVLSERGQSYIDAPSRREIKFEASDAGATASEEE